MLFANVFSRLVWCSSTYFQSRDKKTLYQFKYSFQYMTFETYSGACSEDKNSLFSHRNLAMRTCHCNNLKLFCDTLNHKVPLIFKMHLGTCRQFQLARHNFDQPSKRFPVNLQHCLLSRCS